MTHLVLVGMPGSGKSSVAARCGELLDRAVLDTDTLIQATAASSTVEIFAAEGEAGWRDRESAALADACASPAPLVIACGGGAVLRATNRSAMRAGGFVVWLRTSPEELARRVGSGHQLETRPLLAGGAPAVVTLGRLASRREAAYEAAAHAVVDTDGRSVDDVAHDVVRAFEAAA